ncbi:hypothetical protein BWQ96_09957 [Gracilariopsis chorda]|uniref:Uncharacterized protein n=1 Tax=Gracilariopsis chorda TaxID=448386 RepID=A0A2V3IE25_9FLOR|nr:hypothetical protein BWQ96_09957 [Gracilariopsis chorda]|eukprot:PXF40336.1 hypothetical protein BWQ96_09957 [Gracilariopsis chorda]
MDHGGANEIRRGVAVADAVSNSEETTLGPNDNNVFGSSCAPKTPPVSELATAALRGSVVGSGQRQISQTSGNGHPAKCIRPGVGAKAFVVLTVSHNQLFASYCCGRKKMVQKIPGAAWKLVYGDFWQDQEEKFQSSGEPFDGQKLPQERSLRDALRSTLNDIRTDISDEAHGKVTVQDVQLMTRLNELDMYNWKKMRAFRKSLVSNASNHSGSVSNDKPQTRKELLKDAVDCIKQISKAMDLGSDGSIDSIKHQNKALVLENDLTGKKELRASELAAKQIQELDGVMNRLITLKNNGIRSEEGCTCKLRVAVGL